MTTLTVSGVNLNHGGDPPQDKSVTTTMRTSGAFSSGAGINTNKETWDIDNSTGAWAANLEVPTDGSAVLYAFAFPDGSAYTIAVSSSSSTSWETLKATAGDAETYDPATLDLYMQKSGGTIADFSETYTNDTDSGAAHTIDFEDGTVHGLTLTAACTLTFDNPPASGVAGSFTLILRQDGTGSRLVTWSGSVEWADATEPTLTTDANGIDILTFLTVDGGTTWYGFTAGQAFG